jgi:hypothetical protein
MPGYYQEYERKIIFKPSYTSTILPESGSPHLGLDRATHARRETGA